MKWSHLPFPSVVVGLLGPTKAWRFAHFLFCKPSVWEDSVVCDVSVSEIVAMKKAWWSSVLLTPFLSWCEWISMWVGIVDEERNESGNDDDDEHEVISLAFSISCCGPSWSKKSLMICLFPFLQTKWMGSFCHAWCIRISDDGDVDKNVSASYSILILLRMSEHCGWKGTIEVMMMMNMKWSHLPSSSVVVDLLGPTKAW